MNTHEQWQVTTTHRTHIETAFNADFTEFTTSHKSTSYALAPWVGPSESVRKAPINASSRHGTLNVALQHVYPTGERCVLLDRTIDAWDHDESRKLRTDVENALHHNIYRGNLVQITTSTTTHISVVHRSTIPIHILEGYRRNYRVKPT